MIKKINVKIIVQSDNFSSEKIIKNIKENQVESLKELYKKNHIHNKISFFIINKEKGAK